MLKDVETGKILKTKSEVSALQDFISWLKEAKEKSKTDGVVLVCHEPARKVLVPLFLEALRRYNLLEAFDEVVVAFANSVKVAEKFADSEKVTSYSLRSLCKTILNNTNPATASACDRAKVLVEILSKISPATAAHAGDNETRSKIDASKVLTVATSVKSEQDEVQTLKSVLGTQGTLRPIFEGQLKQKRAIREHALGLRKLVAEAGLKYEDLAIMYKNLDDCNSENAEPPPEVVSENQFESRRNTLKASILDASDKDLEELVKLLDKHFIKKSPTIVTTAKNANVDENLANSSATKK